MPPSNGEVKVDLGFKLFQASGEGDEEKSNWYGDHVEANNNMLHTVFRVAQAQGQYLDEGDNTASNTANWEIHIEDVKETDLGVLTAGDEEPDIEPVAEKNNRQQKDSQHEKEDMKRIMASKDKKIMLIWKPEWNVK